MLRMAVARHAAAVGGGASSSGSHLPLVRSSMRSAMASSDGTRALSTSRILALAQPPRPVTGPTLIKESPPPNDAPNNTSVMGAQAAQKLHSTFPEEMTSYPDYSKGPSALDKASQLFFFTEILRGVWQIDLVAFTS